jgi:hypothetical protein
MRLCADIAVKAPPVPEWHHRLRQCRPQGHEHHEHGDTGYKDAALVRMIPRLCLIVPSTGHLLNRTTDDSGFYRRIDYPQHGVV